MASSRAGTRRGAPCSSSSRTSSSKGACAVGTCHGRSRRPDRGGDDLVGVGARGKALPRQAGAQTRSCRRSPIAAAVASYMDGMGTVKEAGVWVYACGF
jgi:hypothetical protein